MEIEHQIKVYTDQIEAVQKPISAEDVLGSIDVIRVNENTPRTRTAPPRWQRLLAIGAIAAAFLLLFGTSLWFTREILPLEDPAASDASTLTEATSPGSVLRIDTPFGIWAWERIDAPLRQIGELEGILYSVDSPWLSDNVGNPASAEELETPRLLLVSDDGSSWEQRALPDEMQGMYLGLFERNGELFITGHQTDSVEDYRVWSTTDADTWTRVPKDPRWNELGLSVPGITTEGVAVQVRHDDPVHVGDTQLVQGAVSFRFPDVVIDMIGGSGSYEMSQSEGNPSRIQIWTTEGPVETLSDRKRPEVEVTIDIQESSRGAITFDYAFYRGPESDGDLFHTARIEIDASLVVDMVSPDDGLHPWFQFLWRAQGDQGFEVVPIPIERATQSYGHGLRLDYVTAIDGSFVLYGGAPHALTTAVNEFVTKNEPSRIGVIATSHDGRSWESKTIDGFINPQSVTIMKNGTTLWTGEFADWISPDGFSGTVMERSPERWIIEGPNSTLMRTTDSGLWLSTDGEEWTSIAFPTAQSSEGHEINMVGNHLFFSDGSEGFTWVGHFEP